MTIFFTVAGALLVLALCCYLAACAGAERWLALREWWWDRND